MLTLTYFKSAMNMYIKFLDWNIHDVKSDIVAPEGDTREAGDELLTKSSVQSPDTAAFLTRSRSAKRTKTQKKRTTEGGYTL
jgi:hypothetical protein